MNKLLFSVVCLSLTSLLCSGWEFRDYPPPRKVVIFGKMLPVTFAEVVVPERTRLLDFAAKELSTYLGKVTGKKVPVVSKPSGKGVSLILGDNVLARKAGIRVRDLIRDGYFIRREGNLIYLAGLDSKVHYPAKNIWSMWFDRGTISAVYEFLERFCSVRFYFPGEMGTVAEPLAGFALPEKIDITERPDFQVRFHSKYTNTGVWYEKKDWKYDGVTGENLQWMRNRLDSSTIPPAHGLATLRYGDRFKNPEFFALMPNGKRYNNPSLQHSPHLCFSSGVTEEIYKDVKAYLTGKSADTRGFKRKHWNVNAAAQRSIVSVMPHDWFYMCCCDKCKKLVPKGARTYQGDEKACQQISELVFGMTARIGNRLKKEGIKGYITQMSYTPYYQVPKVDLPDNVLVMTAVMGPWNRDNREDDALLKAWNRKLKHRTWIWTYSYKYSSRYKEEVLPEMCPRAVGKFYQDRKDLIFGAYHAGPTEDSFLYTYLNFYTFGKVAWNNNTNVDQLLKEHHHFMFGKGAAPMGRFYDLLEKCFLQVVGEKIDTPLGPVTKRATEEEVWNKIYTSGVIKEMEECFRSAERLASGNAYKRVLFIRKHLFEPLKKARRIFCDSTHAFRAWSAPVPGTVVLRHCTKEESTPRTEVKLSADAENLTVRFHCEEPAMKEALSTRQKRDKALWTESCVEVMLCADPLRKKYYHFIVNMDGSLYDAENTFSSKGMRISNAKWNSSVQVKVQRESGKWTATLVIPKKEIGAEKAKTLSANFGRSRKLRSMKPGAWDLSMWSPFPHPGSYHKIHSFGTLYLTAAPAENLLKNGDFTLSQRNFKARPAFWSVWGSKGMKNGQSVRLDDKIFVSGGKSLHLRNVAGGKISAGYRLTGKPDTTYRLSFYMKTRDVLPNTPGTSSGCGAYIFAGKRQFGRPVIKVTGTTPWRYHEYTFRTGKEASPRIIIGLWNWFCAGDVWYDRVRLEELR